MVSENSSVSPENNVPYMVLTHGPTFIPKSLTLDGGASTSPNDTKVAAPPAADQIAGEASSYHPSTAPLYGRIPTGGPSTSRGTSRHPTLETKGIISPISESALHKGGPYTDSGTMQQPTLATKEIPSSGAGKSIEGALQPLTPQLFEPLRIAGAVLFATVLVFTAGLINSSKKCRHQREEKELGARIGTEDEVNQFLDGMLWSEGRGEIVFSGGAAPLNLANPPGGGGNGVGGVGKLFIGDYLQGLRDRSEYYASSSADSSLGVNDSGGGNVSIHSAVYA